MAATTSPSWRRKNLGCTSATSISSVKTCCAEFSSPAFSTRAVTCSSGPRVDCTHKHTWISRTQISNLRFSIYLSPGVECSLLPRENTKICLWPCFICARQDFSVPQAQASESLFKTGHSVPMVQRSSYLSTAFPALLNVGTPLNGLCFTPLSLQAKCF